MKITLAEIMGTDERKTVKAWQQKEEKGNQIKFWGSEQEDEKRSGVLK